MANITGCTAPGAQLLSADVGTDSSAADALDKLMEKAKEEQMPALPAQVVWCPPPPCRVPEGAMLTLNRGDGEKQPHWVVHPRCHAEHEPLPAAAERKPISLAMGERVLPQPERQNLAAAPQPQPVVTPLPRHHLAPLPIPPSPLIASTVHQRPVDEPRRDNPQAVLLVKSGSETPVRQYEPPSAPRHAKQEFTPPVPGALPAAKQDGDGQSRISYAFRSWGSEHRVELTSLRRDQQPLTVLLTPSDNLVNRRLQEAVAAQPLDVNLVLNDEGGGDQQRQQQRDDQPSEAEDER